MATARRSFRPLIAGGIETDLAGRARTFLPSLNFHTFLPLNALAPRPPLRNWVVPPSDPVAPEGARQREPPDDGRTMFSE